MRSPVVEIRRFTVLIVSTLWTVCAVAEPYLAVQNGYQCNQCHVDPTGGGLRNAFGDVFSQTALPANASKLDMWTGSVLERFSAGSDARGSGRMFDLDDRDDNQSFGIDRVSLYLDATLNEHVSLYLDEQVAPNGSLNRQAWVMLASGDWYLKAGKLFLPYGLRLEDDSAFVREITGINFNSPDNGVEAGFVGGAWSAQVSLTNGTAGAPETDDGKQISVRLAHVNTRWRIGVSGNLNRTDPGDRTMYGLFGGVRTGPVSWLMEYDRIEDDGFGTGNRQQDVALLQAAIELRKGHYLQLITEMNRIDDRDITNRYRYSAVYEYFPWPFTELRAGYRQRDSQDDSAVLNASETFVQVHVFF